MSSKNFPPGASLLAVVGVVAALTAASIITVIPKFTSPQPAGYAQYNAEGQGGNGSGPGRSTTTGGNGGTNGTTGRAGSSGRAGATPSAPPGGYQCAAGRNGGATDTGVSANQIKLASTVAESGIAESFLGPVRYGMYAIVNQTNSAGGICGRTLQLDVTDDGWSASTGEADIRNFISEGYFALPVEPSSEGLNSASKYNVIDSAGIPVIGTDGMLYSQYSDPWIWPVASSTISTAHIAAYTAYQAGARTFGIVYDSTYKFGTEGDAAFAGEVSRICGGGCLKTNVGITSGQSDYSSQGSTFNNGCNPRCDMVFVLVDPSNAETWFSTSGMNPGGKFTEGPQPLFVDTFGQNCGAACNNMVVWTSYYPPRPPFDGAGAVTQYVNAVRSVSASADVDNQFLEGGYYGMELFVQALKAVGPDLTRSALKSTMDSTTFNQGLAQSMSWSSGHHFANTSMLGFSIQYSGGFNGFQYLNTGWVADPAVGKDAP